GGWGAEGAGGSHPGTARHAGGHGKGTHPQRPESNGMGRAGVARGGQDPWPAPEHAPQPNEEARHPPRPSRHFVAPSTFRSLALFRSRVVPSLVRSTPVTSDDQFLACAPKPGKGWLRHAARFLRWKGSPNERCAMLRITYTQGHDSVLTLHLEGKLLGPWVTELARSCNELPCPPNRLRLDLSAVTFVDGPGVALLRDLLARGATLAACSGLV